MFEGIRKAFVCLMAIGAFLAVVTAIKWLMEGAQDIGNPLDLIPW